MKIIVATLVETAAGRSQAWFDGLKPIEQRRYLKEHPGSKFGQKMAVLKPSAVKAPAAPVSRIQSLMQAYDPESGKGGRPIARHVNSALQKKGTFDEFHKISKQVSNLTKRINKAKAAGQDYSELNEKRKIRNAARLNMLKDALGKMPVADLRRAGTLAVKHKPEPVVEPEPEPVKPVRKPATRKPAVKKQPEPVVEHPEKPTPAPELKPAKPASSVPEEKQDEIRKQLSDIPKPAGWWEKSFPGADKMSAWATDMLSDKQKEDFAKSFRYYATSPSNRNSSRNSRPGEAAEEQARWNAGRKAKAQQLAEMLGVPFNEERAKSWVTMAQLVYKYINDAEAKKANQV